MRTSPAGAGPWAARRSCLRLAGSRRWQGRDGQKPQKMAESLRVSGDLHRAIRQQRADAIHPHDAARWDYREQCATRLPPRCSRRRSTEEVTLAVAERGQEAGVPGVRARVLDGDCRRVLAGYGRSRPPGHGYRVALPPGWSCSCATVHLLTTATLDRLRYIYPHGQFGVQRFRPNIVVDPVGGEPRDSWKMPGSGRPWPSGTRCVSASRGPAVAV